MVKGTLSDLGNHTNVDALLPVPKCLTEPIQTYPRTLISGGPTNPYVNAQQALLHPQMGMFEDATLKIMEEIKEGLRYLFQTKNQWTLALTGTAHTAIDTVLDNLIEPGDTILVPITGMWGHRVCDSAIRLGFALRTLVILRLNSRIHFNQIVKNDLIGGNVKPILCPSGSVLNIKDLENAMKKHRPNLVYIVNGDSNTGLYQNVEGIGELCHEFNCLLIVDAVATLGIVPFHTDKWKIDVAFCNSQKGIGAPVGLAPVTFSPRAVEKALNRKTKTTSYRNDMNLWKESNFWNLELSGSQICHHSYAVLLFYCMREALALIAIETLDVAWARNANANKYLDEQLKALNLEYFVPNPEVRLPGTILLKPPNGVKPSELANYMRERHNMDLGTGFGPFLGKVIRIAFLGVNANIEIVDKVITALQDGINYSKI